MATVTICRDFRAQKKETYHYFHLFPSICHGAGCHDLSLWFFKIFSFKLAFSSSSFTLIRRSFSSSSLSAIRVISSTCLRLSMFLPAILIAACNSSGLAFRVMCSVYKLNKQPCHTPFSVLNQSVVSSRVLTVASWPTYMFLRRQVRWSGILICFKNFPVCCDPHSQRL